MGKRPGLSVPQRPLLLVSVATAIWTDCVMNPPWLRNSWFLAPNPVFHPQLDLCSVRDRWTSFAPEPPHLFPVAERRIDDQSADGLDKLTMAEDVDSRRWRQSLQSRQRCPGPVEQRAEALGTISVTKLRIGIGPVSFNVGHSLRTEGSIPALGLEIGKLLDRPNFNWHVWKAFYGGCGSLLGAEVG